MVSVSTKPITTRVATATGRIYLPSIVFDLLSSGDTSSPKSGGGKTLRKGDVLQTARLAGIMGGKQTSGLIPLCHPIGLTDLKVVFRMVPEQGTEDARADREVKSGGGGNPGRGGWCEVKAVAECNGQTGVEVCC
jgi:cyclic pyranopterin phosphate synthase